ncbi:MAG: dimethylsulfonioproprionate lyase family protein [Albidovulum sp.]
MTADTRTGPVPDAAPLHALLASARTAFGLHDSDIARRACEILRAHLLSKPVLPPATVPPCRHLNRIVGAAPGGILAALGPCAQQLHWRRPGFGKLPARVADHMAVVELIGPDGMLPDSALRFGLLLQEARLQYPWHRHAAEELYLVLSGRADWAVDNQPATPRAPGTFIHHQPNQPHAMMTADEPLLAAWVWTGDIGAQTYAV